MGHSHIFIAQLERSQRDDESEWEYISSTTAEWLSADELARVLRRSMMRDLQDGHAYSSKELRELRDILEMEGDEQSDIGKLRSESDIFAFWISVQVHFERRLSRDVRKFHEKFLQPADTLLRSLNDQEFVDRFLAPSRDFKGFDHAKFKQELQTAVTCANGHVAAVKQRGGRGKAWDHDLKRLHVYLTACFCEYFNNAFEPKRLNSSVKEERHRFQEAVELLAKPLFKTGGRGSGFTGAIREHVDQWNAAKNENPELAKMLGSAVAK
jgi:hypothetical protein